MKPVFVDSGAWIALTLPTDTLHPIAFHYFGLALEEKWPLVTTSACLFETYDALSEPRIRYLAREFREYIARLPSLEIVYPDRIALQRALDFFLARPDKAWSLTDCLSFALIQERGISDAMAFDKHFWQAGLRPLMREDWFQNS